MKKLCVLFLLLTTILSFGYYDVYSADMLKSEETTSVSVDANSAVIASGSCGDTMTWTLSGNGDMVISGTGEMWDLWPDNSDPNEKPWPWESYRDKIVTLTIQSGVEIIGEGAFAECTNLKTITFPNTLQGINNFAFINCTNLGNFTLPEGMLYIGQQAFDNCDSITSLTIPNTVTFIDSGICNYADSLKYVYIGGDSSVPTYVVGSNPIGITPALEKIEVSEDNIGLTSIDGVLYSKDEESLMQYPAGKKDKSYTLPSGTKAINQMAIVDAVYLEELVLPEGLEYFGVSAIWDCQELTSLTIPSTVTAAEKNAIDCCWNLLFIENKSQTKLDICEVNNTVWMDANGNRVTELGMGTYYQYRGVSKIEVDSQYNLNVGESVQLPKNFEYTMLHLKETKADLLFTSSNTSVVRVDAEGNARAVGNGTAVVTIAPRYVMDMYSSIDALTVSCVITVEGEGQLIEGWQQDEYGWKYMKEDGTYATNCWLEIAGEWYAFDEYSYMREGWFLEGSTWYFLNYGSGTMATGWVFDGGTWYYMHSSGAMATGWVQDGGTWYYMNGNGAMATGWVMDGGTWYYMNGNGAMATGWVMDNGTWYYMNGNGAMATGWVLDGGNWYYMHGSGAMATGWIFDGGNWYYLYENGIMARDTWIGDCYVDDSGVWIP